MKTLPFILITAFLILSGCTEKTTNVTQVIGPEDWQPPVLTWLTPPESDVRGTVGIDVSVVDSSLVTSVRLYVDGIEDQTATIEPFRFEIVTDSLTDGVHLLEARAWDQYGNMGVSPILRMNVANQIILGPHVIWVPDSFATIQAAINASTDYDTIRVRDGTYYETLNLFGKGIWIESENGPMRCNVGIAGANSAFFIMGNQLPATIRGFSITGSGYLMYIYLGGQGTISNNIVTCDTCDGMFIALDAAGSVRNNLFSGSRNSLLPAYFLGDITNNIIRNATEYGLWNASGPYYNPVEHTYNVFWQNTQNYTPNFSPGLGEFEGDPLIDLLNGTLLPGSPCEDAGDSTILDLDGTRSDIGPFGGPYAY